MKYLFEIGEIVLLENGKKGKVIERNPYDLVYDFTFHKFRNRPQYLVATMGAWKNQFNGKRETFKEHQLTKIDLLCKI